MGALMPLSGYSEAILSPGRWNEVGDGSGLRASSYVEPGLYAEVSSRIGHGYECVKSDEGKMLYFTEVQYDKFDFLEFWNRETRKLEKRKQRGTYGKRMKFYSYKEAKAWCVEYMKSKRSGARKAFLFNARKFPGTVDKRLRLYRKIKLKKRPVRGEN